MVLFLLVNLTRSSMDLLFRRCDLIPLPPPFPLHPQGRQVTTLDLEEMGRYFCVALSQLEDEGTAELLGEVREKEDAVGKGRGLGWSRKGVEEGQSGSSETNEYVVCVCVFVDVCV